jgi:hypothetical protein
MLYADFSSLVPGARVPVTDDGLVYAVDLTMVITEKNRDESGLALRRLKKKAFPQVLEPLLFNRSF